jgi:hypothetical protein
MKDFGVFAFLVAIVTSLAAAASAIRLAFMKRTTWQPPEEVVASGASRLASLMAMVFISLLFVFGARIGLTALGITTVLLLLIAIVALTMAISTNVKYSYYYPATKSEANRKLGGSVLTSEAANIKATHGHTEQEMFVDVKGAKDKIWTRQSQASVNIRSVISFIALIGFGTCSLAAAGMLVAVATSQAPPTAG